MELKYPYILIIGLIVIAVLIFLSFFQKKKYSDGKKLSGLLGIEESAYYKRKIIIFKMLNVAITATYIVAIALGFFLLAKPYKVATEVEEKYSRDIILTMDVSTSVNDLNLQLVEQLEDTVEQLKGDRFGIVIFNTSSVMICPLTDDYEYVIEVLEQIKTSLKEATAEEWSDDWLYNFDYITEGTVIGSDERGSSLIGDGLASTVCNFSDIDTDKDRTRIIIFSTDNDPQGTPYFTLDEAAQVCADKKITVFGIGTELMYDEAASQMKDAMEKTGGKFYMEEESGSVEDIVENINKEGKNLIKGKTIEREIPIANVPIILFAVAFLMQLVFIKMLKL